MLPSWKSPLLSFNAAFDDDLASVILLSAFCSRCNLDTSICPPAVQVFYFPLSISPSRLVFSSSFVVLFNHKASILVEHTQIHLSLCGLNYASLGPDALHGSLQSESRLLCTVIWPKCQIRSCVAQKKKKAKHQARRNELIV